MIKTGYKCFGKRISFSSVLKRQGGAVSLPLDKSYFLGDGLLSDGVDEVSLLCDANQGAFQLRFLSKRKFLSNGIFVRFKVSGWRDLKYIAIGFTKDKKFTHVKILHPKQDEWICFRFSMRDLVYLIQNDWEITGACLLSDLRVFVKGDFGKSGGKISVSDLGFFLEEDVEPKDLLHGAECSSLLVDIIYSYWRLCYKKYSLQADAFSEKGTLPVYGDIDLCWGALHSRPEGLGDVNTYRYSFHALHSISMLLLKFEDSKDGNLLLASRELIGSWLESSFFKFDEDQKYVWYDHGVAERTLVLIALWQLGLRYGYDRRFMLRISYVLFKHAELLHSEAFYASHQLNRYHNHAWFQDIALIASAICFQHLDVAEEWLEKGLERLKDQLAHLIHRESGYAVFVENSIGYHQGVQRLVGFAGQLETLAGRGQNISTIASELDAWSQDFRYPDGRSPAQGDTFRQANPSSRADVVKPESWDKETLRLPLAGYAVVKGGDCNCPWMFGFLGTNLNATHKHEDDLSFFLWLDGVEWLVDPSFISHEYTDEIPAYLRSAKAHNMLHVEGVSYNYKPSADRVTLSFDESAGDSQLLTVIGRNRSCTGYEVVRDIRCNELSGLPQLVCTDLFNSSNAREDDNLGEALGLLTFHFGDGVQLAQDKQRTQTQIELSHPASSKKLILTIANEDESEVWDSVVDDSVCGLGFMRHIATQALRIRLPVSKKCRWTIDVK